MRNYTQSVIICLVLLVAGRSEARFHWLQVFERTKYKLCVLVSLPTRYGSWSWPAISNACPILILVNIYVRRQHHNWSYPSPAVQHLATGRSLSPLSLSSTLSDICAALPTFSRLLKTHLLYTSLFTKMVASKEKKKKRDTQIQKYTINKNGSRNENKE